ncbi:MAG: valine--tRNA ligase [Candidatus Nanoarchaeia archaeon]
MDLPQNYDAKTSEVKWMEYWEKNRIYKFDLDSKNPIYSIDTPPPTVSGKMHIGHAFSYAQQDFVARFQRMLGKNVFYPFGTDDNGLATERMIEQLKNLKAAEMPRDEFVKICLETLEKDLRPKYLADWKRLGVSCDFSIFYTTINKHCQRISQWSFIDLYKKNRVYRKRTPFMWCPECQTSIAQVELNDKKKSSKFVYIKFETSKGKPITIATTRPELMPACVGIHVNPNDKRYKDFIGAKAKLPIFNREVGIYANKDVDMEFGTGVVYHCTFGDMDDVEWIEKMKIEPIEVMNKDGTFNEKAGKYKGMKSAEAREAIIKDLQDLGVVEKIEPIEHVVNVHERCGTDIEILMTDQWFIKYLDLKDDMLKWGDKLNWYPKHMKNRYDNWVKGLKYDWNISRQRFFGIPFPLWYCKGCGFVVLANESELPVDPLKDKPPVKVCPKCNSKEFIPEKDVMDTWATSSLTPQITVQLMPEKFYKKLFPMSLRPQAHDIITFWLFNTTVKSQLHYKVNPWHDVMISGWALDPHGKKMSKSKGNIIEPQVMIEKYSADCLRFWAASSKLGEDLPVQEKEFVAGKKFVTKIWNASKFCFTHLADYIGERPKKLELFDEWLLLKLNKVIEASTKSFENYDYSRTKSEVENFFWNVFCDNYLEIVKDRLYNYDVRGEDARLSAQYTLYNSLLTIIKLMAPITPYITEEIYQNYYAKEEKLKSIHVSSWPKYDKGWEDKDLEKLGDDALEIISKVRKFKSEHGKALKTPVKVTLPPHLEPLEADLKAVLNASHVKFGKEFKVSF